LTLFLAAGENGRLVGAKERVDAHDETEGGVQHAGRGLTPLLADALVGARFWPVWIATGVLALVAANIASAALQNTSWAFVLPYMTVLAIAALGQMLVVMQAGIDLSTPGVMFLGGYLIVGVGEGSNNRLALAILACLGLGVFVGLVNGILVAILQLNPLIVTLAVGQIVFAEGLHYSNGLAETDVPSRLSDFAQNRPVGIISLVFWVGAGITLAVALLLRYTAPGRRFQAVGANPRAAWMAGVRVRAHVVFAYTAAGTLYAIAAVLLAGVRISVDPSFGAAYLLAPIAAVVIAGASLSGGLASATSTWVAALALTLLNQMLLILGLSVGWQFIVFGAAIIVGMLISGDRVASLLGRLLRPKEAPARIAHGMNEPTS
jgi:ribose transport system permease protein